MRRRALRASPAPFNMPGDDANRVALLNPTILHFSRVGSAAKTLLFLAVAALCFFLIYDAGVRANTPTVHRAAVLSSATPPPAGSSLFYTPVMIGAPEQPDVVMMLRLMVVTLGGFFALFYVGRFAIRTVTNHVAAKIEGDQIYFHSSYSSAPATLRVEDVTVVIFDRADRLPESPSQAHLRADATSPFLASFAARLGVKTRHVLHIGFLTDGSAGNVRLIDNDIEGGTEQLRRFAAQVDLRRRSSARHRC